MERLDIAVTVCQLRGDEAVSMKTSEWFGYFERESLNPQDAKPDLL